MANFERPKIPYNNQSLPYDNRYIKAQNKGKPVQGADVDGDFNFIVDSLNTLQDNIDAVVAGNIPGSSDLINANKLLTTDGMGNLSWVNVDTNNVASRAITEDKLDIGAATTDILGDGAVTALKIAPNAVTDPAVLLNSINGSKILNRSFPFTKFLPPASASIIGGTTTGTGSWYELTLGNYQIATKKPLNNGVTAVSLSEIWDAAPDLTFDGGKIAANSLDGSIAFISNSTPLGTMKSAGTATSVVCGRTTDQQFREITLGDLQVITKTTGATTPSAQNLSTIFNNEGGTPYDGSQLQDDSVPKSKLQNVGQIAPFCMGYVLGNGTVQKSLNLASSSRTGTGYYEVRFTTQANNSNYIVVLGTQDAGAPAFIVANVAQNSRTVNGFDVETGSGAALIDGEFNFVVYAF